MRTAAINTFRDVALAAGHKFYQPDHQCKNGHVSVRRTSTNRCQACDEAWNAANPATRLQSSRKFRLANLEKSRAATAAWAKNNPEKNKEKNQKWHQLNREKNNARARKWQRDNAERASLRSKRWKSENVEKVNAYSRNRRAILRGAGGRHSDDDIFSLRAAQRNKCAYCRVGLGLVEMHVDHIIPLALGGDNTRVNLQLLCETCNLRKGIKHPVEFARSIGRLI